MHNHNREDDMLMEEINQSLAIIEMCRDLLDHKKRDTKALFIALIISLCLNAAIVGAFLWYEEPISKYPNTTTDQTVDHGSNIVNGDQYNNEQSTD